MKTYKDFGIDVPSKINKTRGNIKVICPECRERKTNKRDTCLSINLDKGIWHCHYCGWSGSLHMGQRTDSGEQRQYTRPAPRPLTDLDRRVVEYFNSRGISEATLEKVQIDNVGRNMGKGVELAVCFNYFLGAELINTKYRTLDKRFQLEAGAELIPYNINSVLGKDYVIITEGEIDCLSFIEIGKTSCVSVPNGANGNTSYLDSFMAGWFDDKETIYIATDTDEKGLLLREELINRFGAERCRIVTYGDECKDANDLLKLRGKEALEECIKNAKDVPVEGIYTMEHYRDELLEIYEHGLKRGMIIGHPIFDDICTFETKRLAMVTGIPGCLTGDTRVTLADGSHTTMEKIQIGDVVRTLDDNWNFTTAPVTYKWDSGVKDVYALTLNNGSVVKATKDHKFLTFDGWKPLSDISTDDYLLVDENVQSDGVDMSDDVLKLVALWIANGNKGNNTYMVSSCSKVIQEEVRVIAERQKLAYNLSDDDGYMILGYRKPMRMTKKRYIASVSYFYRKEKGMTDAESKAIAESMYEEHLRVGESLVNPLGLLRDLGLYGTKTKNLFIPEPIFKANNRQLGVFLNMLFACDGSIYKGKAEYSTMSKRLADDVCELLRRFGIQSRVYHHNSKYNGKNIVSYRTSFSGIENVHLFADHIGMIGKEDKIEESLALCNGVGRGQSVPARVKCQLKHHHSVYFENLGFRIHPERIGLDECIGKHKIIACAEYDGNTELVRKLQSGQWTRVKSIDFVGKEMTYDIEVKATHNFVTTCVTSNSGKSEWIDYQAVRLNMYYGIKTAFFSPENMPLTYHAIKIIEKIGGLKFQAESKEGFHLDREMVKRCMDYYADNFFHIYPEKHHTMENILEKARYLIKRKRVKMIVIDPYNRIESEQLSSEQETQYISRTLDKLTRFAQQNDVLVLLMAHPTKIKKDNGNGGIPSTYDIKGSSTFYDKADYSIIVHRDRKKNTTLVRVEKVKFRHLGCGGDAYFQFNTINGRYMPLENYTPETSIGGFEEYKDRCARDIDDYFTLKRRGKFAPEDNQTIEQSLWHSAKIAYSSAEELKKERDEAARQPPPNPQRKLPLSTEPAPTPQPTQQPQSTSSQQGSWFEPASDNSAPF